ncbi:MAG: efflux RND transporter periplasmic adaptor subunit, partial [Gallionellaceae bacterium]|nr:efflux RND transporter periplasmic adaptor subunit [Gallionellaceae bacterium]
QSGADLLRLQHAIKSGKVKRADSTKVELMLEDGSVYAFPGKLIFSDLAVDPSTGSVSIRAVFPNINKELLPGMFARIRFPEANLDNTIKLPQRAVQAGPQGQFVMVVDAESKATPRPVKTGGMSGSDFVISSGLKVGDQVIVNGLQKARPGTVVKPVPWNPQAPSQAPEKK